MIRGLLLIIGCIVVSTGPAIGQTLRELVRESHRDQIITVNVEKPFVPFSWVLKQTDLIVRGTLGSGVAVLSDDETDVVTTYPLISPRVVFPSNYKPYSTPGPQVQPLAISVHGGTTIVEGFKVTVGRDDTPTMNSGTEVIAFLRSDRQRYWIAAETGIFAVSATRLLIPLSHRRGEHEAYKGQDVADFLAEAVRLRQAPK
ncbi:MAG TPA: hypothetical protein VH583_12710 [Vicinamibacterales bacterium]|jgi:hypothetical protein